MSTYIDRKRKQAMKQDIIAGVKKQVFIAAVVIGIFLLVKSLGA